MLQQYFKRRVTVPESPRFLPDKVRTKSSQNRVSWRASTESATFLLDEFDTDDDDGDNVDPEGRRSTLSSPFQTSQWPTLDPLISKRRSSLRLSKNSTDAGTTSKFFCCGKGKKMHIDGVLEGPIVKIKHSKTLPVDYFATYRGKIKPKATALINADGTVFTYEKLNLMSDELAKRLKPIVEEELAIIYSDLIEDLSVEPCIGIARNPCECCVAAILAVWKLGLPYVPLRTFQSPSWRISTIVESIRPLLIIGTSCDETLIDAIQGRCRLVTFDCLWQLVLPNMKPNQKPLSQEERKRTLRIDMLEQFQELREEADHGGRCISIIHRFNGEGVVIATYIRTVTIWNRLYAEWSRFPYKKNEKVGVHSSLDSHEFLGQFLAPLLAGRASVFLDVHDFCGFVEAVQKYKLRRLTLFPELLSAMVSMMELACLLKNKPSTNGTDLDFFDTVKYWFVTGAAIRNELGIAFFTHAPKKAVLVNVFGCRELLTFVCVEVFKSDKGLRNRSFFEIIPMGKPVMNTRLYVLDQNEHITEGSDLGEIYLSAPGITPNPYVMNSQVGSFSARDGVFIPFTMTNPFLEGEKNKKKKIMYQALLKTRDYGKLVCSEKDSKCCSCGKNDVILQFSGNGEGEMTIENYRVNTNEIVAHLMQLQSVKCCHIMVYRPGTPSKAILAFLSISHKHPVTKEEIHMFLRTRIPEYLIPTLIIVPHLPIKNYRINTAQLVETYLKDRVHKKDLNWQELLGPEFDNGSIKLKATKAICRILYYSCGVSVEWSASHLDWTLAELRIHFTVAPGIYRELMRYGYSIEMKEFFAANTVNEIIQLMINNSPPPLPEVGMKLIESANPYSVEVITNSHKKELVKFFVWSNSCGVAHKRSIVQYCSLTNGELRHVITGIWPLIVYKGYSIVVRDKGTKKILICLLCADCRDKAYCQQWQDVAQQHPTKYRLGIIDQVDESLAKQGLINTRYPLTGLGTLFFMYDFRLGCDFEKSVQVLKLLFAQAIQTAKSAGFNSMHVTIYDYVFAEFVAEAFNFEVIEYKQANLYQAMDGTKPFHLAPDHITGTVLYKVL